MTSCTHISIIRPAPRRTKEHHISLERGRELEEVPHDELDAIGDAVYCRVVLRHRDLVRIDVYRYYCRTK